MLFKKSSANNESRSAGTRILFFTDVHGATLVFKKALSASLMYNAEVLILGGDISGKYIIPLFELGGGRFEATILGAIKQDSLSNINALVERIGGYSYVTTKDEWAEITKSEEKMDKIYLDLAVDRLKQWIKLAEDNLKPKGLRVYINFGNDDHPVLESVIQESSYVVAPNRRIIRIDGTHEMLSMGYANITPWHCFGDKEETELREILASSCAELEDPSRSIFNFHCPPFGTKIDLAPKLDPDLRPVFISGGEPDLTHVGCLAIRSAIEQYQPLVGLHGHIHESSGFEQIGRTICFNPGSEYTASVFKGLLLNLVDDKIGSYLFVNG